jgi:DNA-binding transcriptional LysR family regulator
MALFNLGRARGEIDELRSGSAGKLSVGAIMGAIPAVLARTIGRLRRSSPMLRIRIHHAGTSDSLLPALRDGSIDLAIARPTERDHAGLHFEPLFNETVCVIAAADHPLARRRKLALRDLGRWPWILQPSTSPMRHQIDLLFQGAGLPPPDERIETSSMLATTHLLPGSQLLAAVPVDVAASIAGSAVRVLPVALDIGLGAYGIVTLDGHQLSPASQRFIEALREEAARTVRKRGAVPGR